MAPVYIGLIHYPIYNKHMEVVTTALTNYDLHDIARTAKTYDVKRYFIVHPVEAQREMANRIMNHWKTGGGVKYNVNRKKLSKRRNWFPPSKKRFPASKARQAKSLPSSPPMPVCIRIRSPTVKCAGKSTKKIHRFSSFSGQASA